MLQTLFTIPDHVGGVPLFGFGLLLAIWAIGSLVLLASLVWRQGINADTLSYLPLLVLIGAVILWVLPKLAEEQHGLPIRGYGVMLFLGVTSGTALTVWRGYRMGLDPDMVMTLVFWGVVPGIIGARTYYVVEYWHDFWTLGPTPWQTFLDTLGKIVNITEGGLVVYGSLAGGLIGFAVYVLRKRLPLWATLDLVAPGMLLGLVLGRIGCLMNGCCFGGPCDLPWAVTFPIGSPAYVREVQEGDIFVHGLKVVGLRGVPPAIHAVEPGSPAERHGLRAGLVIRSINGIPVSTIEGAQKLLVEAHEAGDELVVNTTASPHEARWTITPPLARSHPIHPTQLYDAVSALVLCLFLLAYDPFARRDGYLIALLLTLYPMCRFLLECIRTDEPPVLGTPFHTGQVVSLLALAAAAGLWFHLLRRPPGRAFPAWTSPIEMTA
jgi:phosphatidylglycerol:prolipoprotein diacylglycerol transferase